jgi:protease-4
MKDFLKYVLATVTGILMVAIVMGILGAISLVGLAASSASTTEVEDNSVFVLSLSGTLEERAKDDPLAFLTGQVSENLGLDKILASIQKAKDNENIKGIYIEAGAFAAGSPASMHAIREALLDFKKSGKWIVAYGDSYTQATYYISSVADKVFMNPQGMVDWHGLGGETYYLRDLLAKVGVRFQAVKVGKYKSAVEMLTSDHMSEYDREQTEAYINGIWKVMLDDVSKSRKISVDSLNAYADRGITFADVNEFVKLKFVDKLLYTDEVKGEVKKLLKMDSDDDIKQVSLGDMDGVKGKKEKGEKIAVYYAYGDIVDSETGGVVNDDHSIVATTVCKDLEKLMNDDDVKAVVLRVNSPGGSAYASEQIWRSVVNLKAKKPVVVSMGGYAASGGYYISCAANYIYSEPTTITGSIGIFGMFPDVSSLLTDKLAIKFDMVKTNKFADFGAASRPFNADEIALLENYIGRGYELFRKRVADGRKLPVEKVEEIAQGRVWLGNDALGIKLVDGIGSLDDAVKKAAQLAKVDEYYTTDYPDEPGWFESLTSSVSKDNYLDEKLQETLGDYYTPFTYMKKVSQQSAVQARLPYIVVIK